MIEPFYFGKEPKLLLGIYHPPCVIRPCDVGVILCYPMGQEYIRSHRTFLRLAGLLSSAGFHVLRFDFYGCGDSTGNCDQASIGQWVADISTAVDELRNGCDVRQICLAGLRLGASLATMAGAQRGDVDGMILWNPIVKGSTYLKQLKGLHNEWLRGSFAKSQSRLRTEQHREILGFVLAESVEEELERLDLLALQQKPAKNILLIESGKTADHKQLKEHLHNTNVHLCHKYVPSPEVWIKKNGEYDKGLVPLQVLQLIVSWMCEIFK
jgi:pimeloyl-ACP methyl ester carboxylesterase